MKVHFLKCHSLTGRNRIRRVRFIYTIRKLLHAMAVNLSIVPGDNGVVSNAIVLGGGVEGGHSAPHLAVA